MVYDQVKVGTSSKFYGRMLWDVELEHSSVLTFTVLRSRFNDGQGLCPGIALKDHDIKQRIGATAHTWGFNRTDGRKGHQDNWTTYATVTNHNVNGEVMTLYVDKTLG